LARLRAADTRNDLYANLLTTAVLLFIGVIGLRRGLGGLERLEEYAVNLKLAGGGGLFSEFSRRRVSLQRSYLLVVLAAIVVVWSANIFEIIVLASRAFAFYYFLQCLVGLVASTRAARLKNSHLWRTYLVLMALVLLLVVLFATPDS
jgi:hypothetical protein